MSDDAAQPGGAIGDFAHDAEPGVAIDDLVGDAEPGAVAVDSAPAVGVLTPPPEALTGMFRAFYAHYGPALCGEPLDLVDEGGVLTQYFRNLAIEELAPGVVRLKPLGEAWLARRAARELAVDGDAPPVVDLVGRLPHNPAQAYPTRPLSDIRYLVIHHTGAPVEVGPHPIAREHIEQNGWPAIGYHFVIDADGRRYRTQDLTVVSFHAAQFNPAAVGIALTGDWSLAEPPLVQLVATATLLAELCADLGLPLATVRGHREMVPTGCPGETFLSRWKPRLIALAAERLATALTPPVTAAPAEVEDEPALPQHVSAAPDLATQPAGSGAVA